VPVCTDMKWVADVYQKEARIRVDGPIRARRHGPCVHVHIQLIASLVGPIRAFTVFSE
jgi:hypothetical protein